MGMVSSLRDRFSSESVATAPGGRGQTTGPDEPIAGYDRLKEGDAVRRLSKHSQVELEAIETYERAHDNRGAVLDKLRYMRGNEPLPDYDALDVEGIVAELERADGETIKRVRGYERKFASRRDVLEAVERVHRASRDAQPAVAPEPYQAASATQPR